MNESSAFMLSLGGRLDLAEEESSLLAMMRSSNTPKCVRCHPQFR